MQRRPLVLLALLVVPRILFGQAALTVVSAASYQPTVAPGSLASLFGANLSQTSASATLDANGNLPTQLGGISLQVDGQAAALIYVSPLQVNFLVPDATTTGSVNIVVQHTDTAATVTGTMLVQNAAPAVFTSDSSGGGPGAILNAVSFAGAPFLVETTANPGPDKRTRLSIYATGLRFAGNATHDPAITNVASSVNAAGQDAAGKRYQFIVEYAGAAPGYFGLDQVNIVLPAELDGAGVISLSLTAEQRTSNIVTFQVGALPATQVGLVGVALSAAAVTGGDGLTGIVLLNAPARAAGFVVSLRASVPSVQIPLSLTIPPGQTSATFPIATAAVPAVQNVTITAQGGGVSQTAALEVDPANTAQLSGFQVTPSTVQGGHAASATVTLGGNAPAGGATVQVTSDDPATQPPATVPFPFGGSTATFSIPTSVVTESHTANLTATYGRSSKTAQLTVVPVLQLTLQSNVVVGGNSVNGTIALGQAAAVPGVTLNLQSDNRNVAQPPLTVTIPSGQTSVPFTITTSPVTVSRTVTISVTYLGSTQSATLTVNPPGNAALVSLTISPDHVAGGGMTTGTATLGAPAPLGGTAVNLLSSNVFAAQVPQFVQVAQGQTSAAFTVTTSHVASTQVVTITASSAGTSKTATVTVQ